MQTVITKDECKLTLAKSVHRLRKSKGLTQEALAELAGVARKTINRIEAGVHAPEWDIVCRLADALSVSVQEFRQDDSENFSEDD